MIFVIIFIDIFVFGLNDKILILIDLKMIIIMVFMIV